MLCTILSIVNFHTVLFMFPFLFYWLHLKAGDVHLRDSSLFSKRSIMGQLNVQASTTENEEQYTLSNSWKISEVEFIFRQSCRLKACNFSKKALIYAFSKDFARICNLPIFFDIWGTSIYQDNFNCCKVFKMFISTKFYIQDRKLWVKKTEDA